MRALLADDHPLYLEAARARLERLFPDIEIIEASHLSDAWRASNPAAPSTWCSSTFRCRG